MEFSEEILHRRAVKKAYRDKNHEIVRATYKKYYEKHKKEILIAGKKYRDKNIEKVRIRKRIAVKKWAANNPEKSYAKHYIGTRVRSGEIKKPENCSLCNAKGIIHGHHFDYTKPYEVIWLCMVCHRGVHCGRIKV